MGATAFQKNQKEVHYGTKKNKVGLQLIYFGDVSLAFAVSRVRAG
jgi:hypothetical protein